MHADSRTSGMSIAAETPLVAQLRDGDALAGGYCALAVARQMPSVFG